MNKQELIEEVNGLPSTLSDKRVLIDKSAVLELVDQLDEPERVVIPKFVVEWIEKCKADELQSLSSAIGTSVPTDVSNWLALDECGNEEVFARAWLDGYGVEQEKLYTVEIPDPHNFTWKYTALVKTPTNNVYVNNTDQDNWKEMEYYQLTEEEIKQDFEWAWAAGFPKEVK